MAEYDLKMIEALAQKYHSVWLRNRGLAGALLWFELDPEIRELYFIEMQAALSALPLTPEALNAIWRGEAVVVPKELTEVMIKATERVEMPDPYEPSQPAPVFTTFEADEARAIHKAMLAASPYVKEE